MRKVVRVTGGGEVKGGNKGWFHGFKGGVVFELSKG